MLTSLIIPQNRTTHFCCHECYDLALWSIVRLSSALVTSLQLLDISNAVMLSGCSTATIGHTYTFSTHPIKRFRLHPPMLLSDTEPKSTDDDVIPYQLCDNCKQIVKAYTAYELWEPLRGDIELNLVTAPRSDQNPSIFNSYAGLQFRGQSLGFKGDPPHLLGSVNQDCHLCSLFGGERAFSGSIDWEKRRSKFSQAPNNIHEMRDVRKFNSGARSWLATRR